MVVFLSVLTSFVNLLFMTSSLWLGFYILTRSSRNLISWLATLSLWSLATLFLRNTLVIHLPESVVLQQLRLVGLLGLPLWFHLTILLPVDRAGLLTRILSHKRNRAVILGLFYGVTVLVIIHNFLFPPSIAESGLSPVYVAGRLSGSSNPYIIAIMVVIGSLTLFQLWQGRSRTRYISLKQLFTALLVMTLLAFLAGFYWTLGHRLYPGLLVFPADIIMGAAMILFGYNVARYNAFIEGRTIERDIYYSAVSIGLIVALSGLVLLTLQLSGYASFLALVVILVWIVVTHSLHDAARVVLDRLFYRRQYQELRANLRALAAEIGTDQELSERLGAIIRTLCRVLNIQKGFIALREEDSFVVEAAEGDVAVGRLFPPDALEVREINTILWPGMADPQRMALLVPISYDGLQTGALVLETERFDPPYNMDELDLLDDLADEIAAMLHSWQLQEENARAMNEILADFRKRERSLQQQVQAMLSKSQKASLPGLAGIEVEKVGSLVEECLRRLHDYSYLGESPLARLHIVDRQLEASRTTAIITHVDRGKALNKILLDALQKLRPAGQEPSQRAVPSREWHQFIVLQDSYVLNQLTREVMSRLAISEPTFHRTRRRALWSLTKVLVELEHEAQHSSQ